MGLRFERIVNADDPQLFDESLKEHDIETPRVWIFNKETNSYYTSPELNQEIEDFLKSFETNNPSASSPFINFCRAVDHLEGEGSPGPVDAPQSVLDFAGLPVEAGPANDAGLPGVGGPVIDLASPLDPFSIHPIIPLALALVFLFLVFLEMRKVWKGMRVREKKQCSVC